jgi:hypothetical protein
VRPATDVIVGFQFSPVTAMYSAPARKPPASNAQVAFLILPTPIAHRQNNLTSTIFQYHPFPYAKIRFFEPQYHPFPYAKIRFFEPQNQGFPD